MELLTILVADYANVAQGGKINVMGIFRNIYAVNFPAVHPSMALIIKLGAELGEYGDDRKLIVKLLDADGKELMNFENIIEVPQPEGGQRPEINAIFALNGIVFPTPGRYQFSVLIDRDVKGHIPLDVIELQPQKKLDKPAG